LKKDKLRVKFRQMLEEEETLTAETKFSKVIMKFCQDERWRAIDEREREDLYQDFIDDLEKRETKEKPILAETKMKFFRKMLEEKKITSQLEGETLFSISKMRRYLLP
jgi:pre-mRNA-processing factor 40